MGVITVLRMKSLSPEMINHIKWKSYRHSYVLVWLIYGWGLRRGSRWHPGISLPAVEVPVPVLNIWNIMADMF